MYKKDIYIGFDSKEAIASEICEFSIKKNSKKSFNINHLKLLERLLLLFQDDSMLQKPFH